MFDFSQLFVFNCAQEGCAVSDLIENADFGMLNAEWTFKGI